MRDGNSAIRVSWMTSGVYPSLGGKPEQIVRYESICLMVFKENKIVRKVTNWDALAVVSQISPDALEMLSNSVALCDHIT